MLWLHLLRGKTLTTPLSPLPEAVEGEERRIVMTGMSSSSKRVTKGGTLSHGRELPSSTWHWSRNLSKEEDPLSEALGCVSSDEKSSIGTTYRSTRDCWMEPPESLPSIPKAESKIKYMTKK